MSRACRIPAPLFFLTGAGLVEELRKKTNRELNRKSCRCPVICVICDDTYTTSMSVKVLIRVLVDPPPLVTILKSFLKLSKSWGHQSYCCGREKTNKQRGTRGSTTRILGLRGHYKEICTILNCLLQWDLNSHLSSHFSSIIYKNFFDFTILPSNLYHVG